MLGLAMLGLGLLCAFLLWKGNELRVEPPARLTQSVPSNTAVPLLRDAAPPELLHNHMEKTPPSPTPVSGMTVAIPGEIKLAGGQALLRGTLFDQHGRPAADREVRLAYLAPNETSGLLGFDDEGAFLKPQSSGWGSAPLAQAPSYAKQTTRTNEQGRFEFLVQLPRAVELQVDQNARLPPLTEMVELSAGINEHDLWLPAGGSLSGVVWLNGVAVEGADVSVTLRTQAEEMKTGADGKFHFSGLPAGEVPVLVVLAHEGSVISRIEKAQVEERGKTVLDIHVVTGASALEGYLTVDGEMPKQRAEVYWTREVMGAEQKVFTTSEGDGYFHFAGLTEGEGKLQVVFGSNRGLKRLERTIDVRLLPRVKVRQDVAFWTGLFVEVAVEGLCPRQRVSLALVEGFVNAADGATPVQSQELSGFVLGAQSALLGPVPEGDYTLVAVSYFTDGEGGGIMEPFEQQLQHLSVRNGELLRVELVLAPVECEGVLSPSL